MRLGTVLVLCMVVAASEAILHAGNPRDEVGAASGGGVDPAGAVTGRAGHEAAGWVVQAQSNASGYDH